MPFIYTVQGQYVTVLLAALHEMRGVNTKIQTIAYIEKMAWFDLPPEDLESYPTHQYEAIVTRVPKERVDEFHALVKEFLG